MEYDPDKLSLSIWPAGDHGPAAKWKWTVWDGGKLIATGTVTGARAKAVEAGNIAMEKLILKARQK